MKSGQENTPKAAKKIFPNYGDESTTFRITAEQFGYGDYHTTICQDCIKES